MFQSESCNLSFLKNSFMQINSKLNPKPYDYLYKFDKHNEQSTHLPYDLKYKQLTSQIFNLCSLTVFTENIKIWMIFLSFIFPPEKFLLLELAGSNN